MIQHTFAVIYMYLMLLSLLGITGTHFCCECERSLQGKKRERERETRIRKANLVNWFTVKYLDIITNQREREREARLGSGGKAIMTKGKTKEWSLYLAVMLLYVINLLAVSQSCTPASG